LYKHTLLSCPNVVGLHIHKMVGVFQSFINALVKAREWYIGTEWYYQLLVAFLVIVFIGKSIIELTRLRVRGIS